MKKLLLTLVVLGVYVVHQDNWNWTNKEVVLGFLPVGLAYHAGYSILAAIMMAVLVKFAWPKHLEEIETKDSGPGKDQGEGH
jgi:uncharacterized oligopeptide transporter (OPT) family protein